MRIGIDASGGDFGSPVINDAVNEAYRLNPEISLTLYTSQEYVIPNSERIEACRVSSRNEELRKALEDMAKGTIQAIITASNSFRLAGSIAQYLRPDVPRPGLIVALPTRNSYLMDTGATAKTSDPAVFKGWAIVGKEYLEAQKIAKPVIGLQNIATERSCPEIRAIHEELRGFPGYVGYAEPADFLAGKVDLLLNDGFLGNLELKMIEEVTDYLLTYCAELVSERRAQAEIRQFHQQLLKGGASKVSPLLGLKGGNLFRVHGSASARQIAAVILRIYREYQ
jgi:glycerol-3-phosphate acyltransferase PlsX